MADTIVMRGGGFSCSGSGRTRNRKNGGQSFSTLDEIHQYLTSKLSSSTSAANSGGRTEERRELLHRLQSKSKGRIFHGGGGLRPPPGPCPSINDIRAALICLIQHSIVTVVVTKKKNSTNTNATSIQKKRRIGSSSPRELSVTYGYRFNADRARYLQRYGRYVEFVRSQSKMLDSSVNNTSSSIQLAEGTSMSATIIHLLLVRGKATTVDIVLDTIRALWPPEDHDEDEDDDDGEFGDSEQTQKSRSSTNKADEIITDEKIECVMKCLHRLARGVHFIERVRPIRNRSSSGFNYEDDEEESEDEDPDEGEYEFDEGSGIVLPPPKKKPKRDPSALFVDQDYDKKNEVEDRQDEEDHMTDRSTVLAWIRSRSNKSSDGVDNDSTVILPPNEVWRVNIPIIQDQICANKLGVLAFRRHSSKSKHTHWLVMAALRYVSHKKHAAAAAAEVIIDDGDDDTMMPVVDETSYDAAQPIILQSDIFTSSELVKYLPTTVKEDFKQRPGGFLHNLENQLNVLCDVQNPRVFGRMTSSGGGDGGASSRFFVRTRDMVNFLHDCQRHQFIKSNLGNDAARTISILKEHSFLESDLVAEKAMMPPKEARDVLHDLFRRGYINLLNLNQGKQYNTSSSIYLWEYNCPKLQRKISDEVCTALLNMRLRRQHEICRGAQFMDRAATVAANSLGENEHKEDQEERRRFAVGLQRIDNAILSLDELSMTLLDFL